MASRFDPYRKGILEKTKTDEFFAKKIGCTKSAIRSYRWRELNPEKNNAYKKKWRKENPEKFRAQCERYRRKNSTATRKPGFQKKCNPNSNRTSKNDLAPVKMIRDIDWMQWEDDLILSSGKSYEELSEYLELPIAKIRRRKLHLISKEKKMKKEVKFPSSLPHINTEDLLDTEIEETRKRIESFKENLDWDNNPDLQDTLIVWMGADMTIQRALDIIKTALLDLESRDIETLVEMLAIVNKIFFNIDDILILGYESEEWKVIR